jgi:hypothetical protein
MILAPFHLAVNSEYAGETAQSARLGDTDMSTDASPSSSTLPVTSPAAAFTSSGA